MDLAKVEAVVRKEFYHLLRDVRSLYLAFALPLLLILLFGYALSLDVNHVKTLVVDQNSTPSSRDLIRKLDSSSYFDVVAFSRNTRDVNTYLDEGWATLAIVIPPDFSENLQKDRDAPLQVILDGSDPNFANISRGYINAFLESQNRSQLDAFLNRQGKEPIRPPLEGRIRVWFNEDLESRNFIIPGNIAVILMIVGAMLTSLVVAREYENGTLETIKSLPLNTGEFLVGKAIPYFVIGMIDVLIAVLMGQILFSVVMKSSFWLMILASALYLAVALTLGLLISSVLKSQLVANQVAVLVTYLPSLLLSNFVFPILNMPKPLQILAQVVPATYYLQILSGVYLKNLGFGQLWFSFLVLLIMFLALALLSFFALKREGI
ncbi:MAG: Inner membrane transport permease YbhS [Syntrophus sp. PtaU1.Bin208]|nr:MAG: Inner membrane transport permease YbhS [Syntrophus sp. PtaU1.Bin208]